MEAQQRAEGTRQISKDGDFERIVKWKEKKWNYDKIAAKMNREGVRSELGKKLTGAIVSNFMITNGFRVKRDRSFTNILPISPQTIADKPKSSGLQDEISYVIKAYMPQALKDRLISHLAADFAKAQTNG